jgi:hypothetical protein
LLSRLLPWVVCVCLHSHMFSNLFYSQDSWVEYSPFVLLLTWICYVRLKTIELINLFEKPCYFSILFYISKDTWLYHCVFVYNLLKWPFCACLKTFPTYVFFVLLKASDLCILCSSNDFWPGYSVFDKIIQTWVFFIYIYIANWKQTELFLRPNYNYQWYSYYYECKCYDISIQISSFNI